jgi:two-component system alkaline phosphatase synthesis response regulator PhoP
VVHNALKIVIVDDNQDQLNFLTSLLRFHGYTPYALTISTDILGKISSINPHLIILDIMMPKMNGYTLLKKIRDHNQLGPLPIIIYTGKFYDVDKKKAFALGANSFIIKPVRGTKLIEEITKYV